jgi:four helix bundle protein
MSQQEYYKGFRELNCWKEARQLRIQISGLCKQFPLDEKYLLISQMVKASRSVTANIAEGYGRFTYIDTRHFFILARGSVTEILDHLSVALDENYITPEIQSNFEKQCETVFKLLNGYIAYLDKEKNKKNNTGSP